MSDYKDTQMILEMAYNGLFAMKKQAESCASSMKEDCIMYHQGYIEALIDAADYVWDMKVCCDNHRERENEDFKERAECILQLRGADNENYI